MLAHQREPLGVTRVQPGAPSERKRSPRLGYAAAVPSQVPSPRSASPPLGGPPRRAAPSASSCCSADAAGRGIVRSASGSWITATVRSASDSPRPPATISLARPESRPPTRRMHHLRPLRSQLRPTWLDDRRRATLPPPRKPHPLTGRQPSAMSHQPFGGCAPETEKLPHQPRSPPTPARGAPRGRLRRRLGGGHRRGRRGRGRPRADHRPGQVPAGVAHKPRPRRPRLPHHPGARRVDGAHLGRRLLDPRQPRQPATARRQHLRRADRRRADGQARRQGSGRELAARKRPPDKRAWPTLPWPDDAAVLGEVRWTARTLL